MRATSRHAPPPPPPPPRTNWTRVVPPFRTNWTRLGPRSNPPGISIADVEAPPVLPPGPEPLLAGDAARGRRHRQRRAAARAAVARPAAAPSELCAFEHASDSRTICAPAAQLLRRASPLRTRTGNPNPNPNPARLHEQVTYRLLLLFTTTPKATALLADLGGLPPALPPPSSGHHDSRDRKDSCARSSACIAACGRCSAG